MGWGWGLGNGIWAFGLRFWELRFAIVDLRIPICELRFANSDFWVFAISICAFRLNYRFEI